MLSDVVDIVPKLRSKHLRFLKILARLLRRYRYVPIYVVSNRLGLKSYFVRKIAEYLSKYGLIEIRKREYEGYGLTTRGLDLLALHVLGGLVDIRRVAKRFDVGKEADIHICYTGDGTPYIVKVFRLGRTSFKKVRSVRPGYYTSAGGWLLLNIKAAGKEYEILQRLWNAGVSVPKPIAKAYHMILMEYVPGKELHKVQLASPKDVFIEIVREILKAYYTAGIVHADLSEYNVLVDERNFEVWLIDWPQWLDVDHIEAQDYLRKDIEQIIRFFNRKYRIPMNELWGIFEGVHREYKLMGGSGETH